MAKIPDISDPTLDALKRAVELNQSREKRDYLGASLVGEDCARRIWYQYHGYDAEPISAIGLMAADSGYYAEDITAKRLRAIDGIKLWTHDDDGEQYGWSYLDGKMKGHYDGIIRGLLQAPKSLHVWEHKDKNHKMFSEFKNCKNKFGEKFTLKNWDKKYYGQSQINMHFAQINRHYMTVSYAGARDYDSCRTEYSPEDAAYYIDRAVKIIEARDAPPKINDKPDFFLCRFCPFREICHNAQNTSTLPRSVSNKPF